MHEFMVGVATSMVTSVIAVALSWLRTAGGRRWLMRRLSVISDAGIDEVHRQQRLAGARLQADLERARWVKVMAGRGNEITRETFQPMWRDVGARIESVQVLLPHPDAVWLDRRAQEIVRHDPGFGVELLRFQVTANVHYVATYATRLERVELRLHDLPHTARLVVTDRVAYLTPYAAHQHARSSPCLVFRNPSPMYDYCLRLFAVAWDFGAPPAPEITQRVHLDAADLWRGLLDSTRPGIRHTR
ncbi:hypothetical protein Dvina_04240 [Dactylosporangium vinaceum]|uniref:Uncharacterized protein n=1 Tax=Dactylosporangium vinaceum TaxID=53362 RepID=A0ABV5M0E7_9ACTN|nr:hypothetical protein [Dactylosporangium vinaceum]UAB97395.1 hypothetical protein Dvina_04240 [Dactylosporangium vinaceum]